MNTKVPGDRTGRFAIVGAGMLWGTAGTIQALGQLAGMGFGVGAARTIIAAVALGLFAAVARLGAPRLRKPQWTMRTLVPAAGAGAALALYQIMFFVGAAKSGVAVGTLVAVGLAPVIAGCLALLTGQTPGRVWAAATVLAIAGLVLLVNRGGSAVDLWGTAASVTAAAAYVCYTALTRRVLEQGAPPRETLLIIFAVGGCVSVPVIAANWQQTVQAAADLRGIAALVVLGLLSTSIPYLLWIRGMRSVPTALATTLSLSEPLVGTLLGIVVLHERLTPARAVGAVLLLAGLALVSASPPPRTEPAA